MSVVVARTVRSNESLNGLQKAAVLCTVLGAEAAAKVTQQLAQEEVEAISFEIARMGRIEREIADAILNEWIELMVAADSLTQGGLEFAREVLERAYGPHKAAAMLKRIQTQLQDTAGLHLLRNADPTQLSSMLRGEHPQTIALILAHLQAPQTANVLKELPAEQGAEVVYRMARMEKVSPEMLQLIERSMWTEDLAPSAGLSASGGPQAVAAIMNIMPSSLEKELMDGVQRRDAGLCEQIRNLMFVFEDIITLDDRSIQRVLREIDGKELALALKGSSADLQGKIMSAMSQRATASLKEEMEMMGPTKKRDIEAAQANVVAAVRRLEEAGEIVIGGGTDDLVL
ncbi:MAG TPA: flagellar motor switch protein FliG [Gemmatimonadaceae bacterium]|nr:flagellar motor switch protein FliG [Gemmatimonadaceae bacterium]